MTDIRDGILSTKRKQAGFTTRIVPENHPAYKCGHKTLPVKSWMFDEHIVKLSMDEYAIKVLQWLDEHSVNFKSTEPFNAKRFLEEIKTELK